MTGKVQQQAIILWDSHTSLALVAGSRTQVWGFQIKSSGMTVVKIAGTLVGNSGELWVFAVTQPARLFQMKKGS
jgi:hypothetical protein